MSTSAERLEELWRDVDGHGVVEGARLFCERHHCARTTWAADWKHVFPAAPDGVLLQLGAGFGDDALFLEASSPVIAAVHHPTAARVLARHLRDAKASRVEIIVLNDATRLPLRDASLVRVSLEDAAMAAFRISPATLGPFAAELARVVAPGGVVLLGLANAWDRRLVLSRLRRTMQGGPSVMPLDELLSREGVRASPRPSWNSVRRAMARQGFSEPEVYAPLPDERRTEIVVPLGDERILRYCLDNLIRKNSLFVRAALRGAKLLSRCGLFRLAVPYGYLYFRHRA